MEFGTSRVGRRWVIAALAVLVAGAWLPQIQALADAQVDAGLERALISFATARTLNGLISVLQGTELSMQPLGVGLTLTVGQALDPVNDLIEQFSTLMLYASVAFGVQKALLAIGGHWVISVLVSGMAIAWAVLDARGRPPPWLARALLVILLVRFAIPVTTLGSDLLYQQLLAQDYAQQQASISAVSEVIMQATPAPMKGPGEAAPPATGEAAAAAPPASAAGKGWVARLKDRVVNTVPMPDFDVIKASVNDLPERIVRLIVVFLLQTLIIPVVLLWVLYRTAIGLALSEAGGRTAR